MMKHRCAGLAAAVSVCLALPAFAQLRIVSWNVTNYSSGRISAFQTSIYGVFDGRSMSPDVLIGQEFLSSGGVNNFLSLMNAAPGSPGDWAAAPFIDGPDTDSAFFYRTSKIVILGVTVVAVGAASPIHPRNIQRYDIRPVGYAAASATLACYSSHMKAGTASSDQSRRLLEAQRIRDNAETLPAGWHFLLGGDFNIQSSGQSAYQELVGSQANNAGRLFDPIATPGGWYSNSAFRFVHTQDPIGLSGMDDRHDQILISSKLIDGQGFEYVGDSAIPYSTSTWNDPNHTYRAWGNDGSSYDQSLRVAGNQMVGPTIAQALIDTAADGGHLPVLLDFRVPPRIGSDEMLDFGQVWQGSTSEMPLLVANDGDVQLWGTNGVADLDYSLATTNGFVAPAGLFIAAPGSPGNVHLIQMDTSALGPVVGALTILSNAPDEPVREVQLLGEVVPRGDFDGDGDLDSADYAVLTTCMNGPDVTEPPPGCSPERFAESDFDVDGDVDLLDCASFETVAGD